MLLEAGCPIEHPHALKCEIERPRTNDICSEIIKNERAERKAACDLREIEGVVPNTASDAQDRRGLRI